MLPTYQDPPPVINLQNHGLANDQFQVHYSNSNNNNPSFETSNTYVDNDEVIYAKPSFQQAPRNIKYSETVGLPLQSPSAASSLKRDQNLKVESMQTSETPPKYGSPVTISQRYHKNKANAVYQNEPQNHVNSNNPSTHSLSRQSSAFSSYASQKDTLV